MIEYISRDDAKVAVWQLLESLGYSSKHNDGLVEEVEAVFDDIPAADVRPVVLCRDCEDSYEWESIDGFKDRYCGHLRDRWNPDNDRMVDDDDFCKWGRKREEQT